MSAQLNDAALLAERPVGAIWRGCVTRGSSLGAIGLVGMAVGFVDRRPRALLAVYLIAYIFWSASRSGSMALLMVQYLSGGAWGMVARRVFEAATRNAAADGRALPADRAEPAGALPVGAARGALADPIDPRRRRAYLNPTFFYVRAACYFVDLGRADVLPRHAGRRSRTTARRGCPGPKDGRFRVLSGPGLVLYMLTLTFMSVDWVMSLDPHFTRRSSASSCSAARACRRWRSRSSCSRLLVALQADVGGAPSPSTSTTSAS